MKRTIGTFMLVLLVVVAGCSGEPKRDERLSDDVFRAGVEALSIADDFLNGNTSASSAVRRLRVIREGVEAVGDRDSMAGIRIGLLCSSIEINELAGSNVSDVQESRDSLYGVLYILD